MGLVVMQLDSTPLIDGMGNNHFGRDISQATLDHLLGGEDVGLWISFLLDMGMGVHGSDTTMSTAMRAIVPLYI